MCRGSKYPNVMFVTACWVQRAGAGAVTLLIGADLEVRGKGMEDRMKLEVSGVCLSFVWRVLIGRESF